ncbi:hypothetical protein J6590_022336 [Homalodisca vitripennis]|nr:hypothetical protein J6590_022336 [Homalodisca vitripennis]
MTCVRDHCPDCLEAAIPEVSRSRYHSTLSALQEIWTDVKREKARSVWDIEQWRSLSGRFAVDLRSSSSAMLHTRLNTERLAG